MERIARQERNEPAGQIVVNRVGCSHPPRNRGRPTLRFGVLSSERRRRSYETPWRRIDISGGVASASEQSAQTTYEFVASVSAHNSSCVRDLDQSCCILDRLGT